MARRLRLLARRRRARRDARPAEEPDDRAVLVGREPVAQLTEDAGVERRLAQLEDPGGAADDLRAAADRRDDRELVAVLERRVRVGVLRVARESDGRPARGEPGMERDEGAPRVLDRRAGVQLERDLLRADQLALDREQPDPHAHRDRSSPPARHTRSPAPK